MVDENQFVVDDFGDFVGRGVRASAPVRLSDQQDDAGSDAHKKAERGAETHRRHLDQRPVAGRPCGRRLPSAKLSHAEQGADDEDVTQQDETERKEADDDEHNPGPDEILEVLAGVGRFATVGNEHGCRLIRTGAVLASTRSKDMNVYQNGGEKHDGARQSGS